MSYSWARRPTPSLINSTLEDLEKCNLGKYYQQLGFIKTGSPCEDELAKFGINVEDYMRYYNKEEGSTMTSYGPLSEHQNEKLIAIINSQLVSNDNMGMTRKSELAKTEL